MKKLTATILTCGILASCLQLANAAPTMRLSADDGATWTLVTDNGPLDFNPAVGAILYIGPIGGWDGNVAGAIGAPLTGTPTQPEMDVSCQSDSSGPASLIVQISDSGFVPADNQSFTSVFGGHSDGTVIHTAYRDVGNVLFGSTANYLGDPAGVSPSPTATQLLTSGPVTGNIFTSNNVVVANGGNVPYSLTIQTVVVQNGAGSTSLDGHLTTFTPPPTCNCTLSFNSPMNITNCAGDTIPDAVASQNCGAGSVSVPVTVIGAGTNGVCPQIITRTNSATDNCGVVHTFVQTITVNCNPDCTLKASITTTAAGTGGLHAWVADAGPGANYFWTINNGTITNGQGTTNITFVAGADTSKPVTIHVSVSTGAGCITTCNLSIPMTAACTIEGVTLSNTSWNKFNIPTGTSPVVWVHMHIGSLKGVPTNGVTTVQFVGVTLTLNATSYSLPDGVMIFDSSAPATPSTSFTGGKWVTTINPKNLSDEMFFTGAAIPVTASIAAGAKATLTYTTQASVQGLSFNWQWSGAVFTYWPADWNQAMILPYHNSEHAGTPMNITVQKSLIQGPRGGGGSNFTGSWSATGTAACQ